MFVQVRQQRSGRRQEGLKAKLLKGNLQHGLAAGSKVEERLGGEERGGGGRGLRGGKNGREGGMVTTWLPHGYHMVTTWLPHGCQMITTWLPHGYHMQQNCFQGCSTRV